MALLRRQVEALFLVNNGGLLVARVARDDVPGMDPDLMTGMLTAIMSFAKDSFSHDRPRELDYFSLGDRKVELVQGVRAYLAAVYTGSRGNLERNMQGLLTQIEGRFPEELEDVEDHGPDAPIPVLLRRFMDRAWWPLRTFAPGEIPASARPSE